jgi:hypothetical protein
VHCVESGLVKGAHWKDIMQARRKTNEKREGVNVTKLDMNMQLPIPIMYIQAVMISQIIV